MLAHDWLDGLGCFVGVVEGDGADVVVEDVGLDDTVEESAADETEFTIDGCGGSTYVVPALTGVVGKSWVSVLEESDGNKPVVHPEVRSEVPDGHVGESVGLAKHDENSDGDGNSKIAQQNKFSILSLVKRAAWVEVIDTVCEPVELPFSTTLMLLLVVVVASHIGKEV